MIHIVAAALIKSTKFWKSAKDMKWFKKHGDYKLAKKDFDSLKATNVKNYYGV